MCLDLFALLSPINLDTLRQSGHSDGERSTRRQTLAVEEDAHESELAYSHAKPKARSPVVAAAAAAAYA